MTRPFHDSVAVVGYGALLPDAEDAEAFWRNVTRGVCSIREVPASRWRRELYCEAGSADPDKASTSMVACVDDALIRCAERRLRLAVGTHSRLQVMALAATSEALAGLEIDAALASRTDVVFGCMDDDEGCALPRFWRDEAETLRRELTSEFPKQAEDVLRAIRDHCQVRELDPAGLFASAAPAFVRERFGFGGTTMLIDAACASSLAAVDVAMRALRRGSADLVVTGGIESDLGPETAVLFSRLGALAPEHCLPLDARTEGLSQGEGAVALVLERTADALRLGHTVHGILRASGASSDGLCSSLFAPTAAGQRRAYESAWRGLDSRHVDYIECHATGTQVGDATELRALVDFFGDRRLPIGSVKSLIGHTKGTAGAASLLKCILALRHRVIPASRYFERSILQTPHRAAVNREPKQLRRRIRPLRFGISAFGFGGVNHHAVLEEYKPRQTRRRDGVAPDPSEPSEVVLVERHTRTLEDVRDPQRLRKLRIPARSVDRIDRVQLGALLAVAETAEMAHLDLHGMAADSVSVISASSLGLEAHWSLRHRVRHAELAERLERFGPAVVSAVLAHRERHASPTEDTGHGVLNNVIAGRIAKHFDLTGRSFNVDADVASFPAAVALAIQLIEEEGGLVVLVGAEESFDAERLRVERSAVTCWLLAAREFAKQHALPIRAVLGHVGPVRMKVEA